MKRVLASLLVFSLLLLPVPTGALEPKVLERVLRSTVHLKIESGKTICTGFVVLPERIMTAAHCIDDETPLTVDGKATELLKIDRLADLALLKVVGLGRPYLTFTPDAPAIGDEVTALGFPLGGSALIVLEKKIAGTNLVLSDCGMFGLDVCVDYLYTVVVDTTYVPGMSGGPNVNEKGQIVSITQAGVGILGLGQGAEVMKDFLRR